MGMTEQVCLDLMGARWIAPALPLTAARIYKRFCRPILPLSAKIYISGLGYFEARMNGVRLCEDMLIPPASDYFKRDLSRATYPTKDDFTHRIYYHEFDVTDKLREGDNLLDITLGGGWLTQDERIAEGEMHYSDRPMCIFRIEIDGEEILSDGSETFSECEIRRSRLFFGEDWELGFVGEEQPVIPLLSPNSILSPAIGQNDRIIRELCPRLVFEADGRRIYDAGENISGLVRLELDAAAGSLYTLTFAENYSNGELNPASTGYKARGRSGELQLMRDTVKVGNGKCTFMPKFTWHAFRYFELSGDLSGVVSATVCVIHASTDVTAEFECDHEGAEFLFDAYIRTQLSNLHGSLPSDCPHRERLGYTGDGQITARSAMMMLDSRELYRKWIRDILDSQDINSGHVQHTAPYQGGGGGPGGWGSAIITVPYAYYKQFADAAPVEEALPAMRRFIEFTYGCCEDGLVVRESNGGWCLGDWCMMKDAALPEPFVNTCWFIHSLRLYLELCSVLLREREAAVEMILGECLSAVIGEYPRLSHIGAAKLYGAWIGIAGVEDCAEYYRSLGHFDTGFLGTDILMELLFKGGFGDVASMLLSSEEEGSFLYMKRHGATTIWERWHGANDCSHSHPMFGAAARQLFEGILGIRQAEGSFGYDHIIFKPYLPEEASFAKGSFMTPNGRISVSLWREDGEVRSTISTPDGVTVN